MEVRLTVEIAGQSVRLEGDLYLSDPICRPLPDGQ